ncbi:MAG TPA: glycosyltransferase [Anaerovoracaceae bacterium]|nr:glycosyltransferase [Anaerovoracaceae bacterium]
MIKLAFVIDTIESPTAGTEKQLLMLINNLHRSRFSPHLCVLRRSHWLEKYFNECPLFVAGVESFRSIKGIIGVAELSSYLKKCNIDIVQTHFRDGSIAGILAARLARTKVILGTRRNQGYWMSAVDFKIQKILDRWVDGYITNSESTRSWVTENEGIHCGKMHVIYNGFDIEHYMSPSASRRLTARKKLEWPQELPVVGIVANLRPVKDHLTFLRSARVVKESIPSCRFVIIGDGDESKKLIKCAQELNISEDVMFLGQRNDVPEILSACDVGVLSSASESFPNAIVEYMASGLPVVTTDVGGVREAVVDGVNGYIVGVGDWKSLGAKIINILSNVDREVMGWESYRRGISYFSSDKMVSSTALLYEKYIRNEP